VAYTSVLKRAEDTLAIILKSLGQMPPVIRDPALNERHYGDLQGLDKAEAASRFGKEQVHIWRRSFDIEPPNGESLADTARRTQPFFDRAIRGDLKQGKNVLVVAHGNSNRSIVMLLDRLNPSEVMKLELATGLPVVYTFSLDGEVIAKEVRELKAPAAAPGAGIREGS
jgi:2,3-bisphosphoglycerate-dependent phosphoglycerate mutase